MRVSEYDAFGPWIYEIDEDHPLPPLFVPHVEHSEAYQILFKLPRDIERRKATPDMDLYDYVVSAYADRVQILTRVEHSVRETVVPYADILGIRLYRKFLNGVCTLYTARERIEITFNTVSIGIMSAFVQYIRSQYEAGKPAGCGYRSAAVIPDAQLRDVLFVNLLRDLRDAGEEFQVGAFEQGGPLTLRKAGLRERLQQMLRPQSMMGAVHLFGDTELLVIEKEVPDARTKEDKYGYQYTYLPVRNVHSVQIAESESYQNTTECRIGLGEHELPLLFHADNQKGIRYYEDLRAQIS